MDEEKEKLLEEVLRELDEMLEAHERYKEEYGKKYENLTPEQSKELELQELRASRDFAEKVGMTIETVNIPDDNEDK